MQQLHNSLVIFSFFKEKFERDLFLMETSVSWAKKYADKCKDLLHFNEDLKQSLFLKQIIDVCAFLDEFKAFNSLARDDERVRRVSSAVKPALKRIEEVKGLRAYRNALAAHNFREEKRKDEVVLISDFVNDPDCPNSIAEMFFLSSLCYTIIEVINTEFESELKQALESYGSSLGDDSEEPLRGIKTIREAYDEVEKYRLKLNLRPKFLEYEIEEFKMALEKVNWSVMPSEFKLTEGETNKYWCEVLVRYLKMRGYEGIEYVQGVTGCYTGHWVELYGHALIFIDKLKLYKPSVLRGSYSEITNWIPFTEKDSSQQAELVYEEIMKVVTP